MPPDLTNTTTSLKSGNLNNKFLLMRHGLSLANQRGLIVSHPENAKSQYGLTSVGIDQVKQAVVASDLNSETIIVSSDYARARETADLARHLLNVPELQIDKRLRERYFGDWELQDHSAYRKVWESDLLSPHEQSNNVETVSSVLNRVLSCIIDLDALHESRYILLVGHGDVLQIALAHFTGIKTHYHRSLDSLENAEIRALNPS